MALNYQFPGKMMDMNQGLFQQNGFSGFVLKPTVLRKGEPCCSESISGINGIGLFNRGS